MGHTLAIVFEEFARSLHQFIDPVPDRIFLLMSGVTILAVGMRLRRSFE
jgi:hypothetical protein